MNEFKKRNIIFGWVTFFLSALVYTLTMEPSVSLWDCGEFISTSYKMEIGHPPGAPLFMMLNRFFSLFATDTSTVAVMINFVSVLASAFTIMFLYWTIAHLALKMIDKTRETARVKDSWLVFGSAFVGAMSFAFTDTFWFNAVEGEVYAQSSLFTAMVFWAMFKWENESDKPYSSRWLILIAYLMGLSIGVHLLNLLSIPALVMIYYYKKHPNKSRLDWWKAFGISIVILAVVLFVVIPKSVLMGAGFDRFFVNVLGFDKNIGFLIFVVLLMSAIGVGIYLTDKYKKVVLNIILLCLGVLMVGYGTYASVIIRSSANLPMNSNHPDDAYSLVSLLNRDQYGSKLLFYGPYYSSKSLPFYSEERDDYVMASNEKKYYYDKETKKYKYEYVPIASSQRYASGAATLFPRMHSGDHAAEYESWVNMDKRRIDFDILLNEGKYNNQQYKDHCIVPSFADNLAFFFKYQVNYMYWRYFLWNFVGRQNDEQGNGRTTYGNWLSGIDVIDEMYLGTQEYLPEDLKNDPSRNTYFFLPFLLGLAGLVYQLTKKKNDFVIVSLMFLMTGLAIIIYLNQTPSQARERDYSYAGSFYAFSIWIGLGVFWVQSVIAKIIKHRKTSIIVAIAISLSVPTILIAQNWDDHDRSNRYVARDFGKNYLATTLPNSIFLPYGDNDTFGTWYAQEVEGYRTDVRICNLSYLQSGWYVNQMSSMFNDSKPIEFTIPNSSYNLEKHNFMDVIPVSDQYANIHDVLGFVALKSAKKNEVKKSLGIDEDSEFFPAKKFYFPVNKENALKAGIISEEDLPYVVDTIFVDLNTDNLSRDKIALIDMIATADWSRPVYFTQSTYGAGEIGLGDYLQFDGFGFRLVPIKTPRSGYFNGRIDTDRLYDNVMNVFSYGNINDPDVFLDIFNKNYIGTTRLQDMFSRLATQLVREGKIDKAKEVMTRCLEIIPYDKVGYDIFTSPVIEALHLAGEEEKARILLTDVIGYYLDYLDYYISVEEDGINSDSEISITLQEMFEVYSTMKEYGYETELSPLKSIMER